MSNAISSITRFIRSNGRIPTCLGDVTITGTLLGQGGNALVYPVDFEGPAVVKILAEPITDVRSDKQRRFEREFKRLTRTPHHSNLIRLYHYEVVEFGDSSHAIIVMEKCDRSLRDHVRQFGQFSPSEARRLLKQMCSALYHIHKQGIIHRDIKPENILVRSDGTYVLADFGIAHFDPAVFIGTQLTERGDRMANFQFSAPEQFEPGAAVAAAADVFALGQVVYWCATGRTFRGALPRLMQETDPGFEHLEDVVTSMAAQDAIRRPATAREAFMRLKALEEGAAEEAEVRRKDQRILNALVEFERLLRSFTPGQRGVTRIQDKDEIDALLDALARKSQEISLWWNRNGNDAIRTMSRISVGTWVIGMTEVQVTDLWVFREHVDHAFVLLRSDAMPSFEVGEPPGVDEEMAGLFGGRYIPVSEHDDGFAKINGQTVALEDRSILRRRYRHPLFLFIATNFNSVLSKEADEKVRTLTKRYEAGEPVDLKELESFTDDLPLHPASIKHR